VLSESTLLVGRDWLVLKTCGNTAPVRVLGPLAALLRRSRLLPPEDILPPYADNEDAARVTVRHVSFSRSSYVFPQLHPPFADDLRGLQSFVAAESARQLVSYGALPAEYRGLATAHATATVVVSGVGRLREEASSPLPAPRHPSWHVFRWSSRSAMHADSPLSGVVEVALFAPDESSLSAFWWSEGERVARQPLWSDGDLQQRSVVAQRMTQHGGVARILHSAARALGDTIVPVVVDAFAFEPCGYSCNAALVCGGYATVHVTPQHQCRQAYASFEVGLPRRPAGDSRGLDLRRVASRVVAAAVAVFKPARVALLWSGTAALDGPDDGVLWQGSIVRKMKRAGYAARAGRADEGDSRDRGISWCFDTFA